LHTASWIPAWRTKPYLVRLRTIWRQSMHSLKRENRISRDYEIIYNNEVIKRDIIRGIFNALTNLDGKQR